MAQVEASERVVALSRELLKRSAGFPSTARGSSPSGAGDQDRHARPQDGEKHWSPTPSLKALAPLQSPLATLRPPQAGGMDCYHAAIPGQICATPTALWPPRGDDPVIGMEKVAVLAEREEVGALRNKLLKGQPTAILGRSASTLTTSASAKELQHPPAVASQAAGSRDSDTNAEDVRLQDSSSQRGSHGHGVQRPDFGETSSEEESREATPETLLGRWVDPEEDFYGGGVIVISPTSWRPEKRRQRAPYTPTYVSEPLPGRRRMLLELRSDGTKRKFEVSVGSEHNTLLVKFVTAARGGEACEAQRAQWTLHRPAQLLTAKLVAMWAARRDSAEEEGTVNGARKLSNCGKVCFAPGTLATKNVKGASGKKGASNRTCTGNFEVLDAWRVEDRKRLHGQTKELVPRTGTPRSLEEKGKDEEEQGKTNVNSKQEQLEDMDCIGLETPEQSCCRSVLMRPSGLPRTAFDLVSLLLVTYDMLMIPFQFFEPPGMDFTKAMIWVTRMFWTSDIVASFLTGFLRDNGGLEMRVARIARRYITTWFALDLVIVGCDWAEVFIGVAGAVDMARAGRVSRVFRIIRMIRLLRLVRMHSTLALMLERIHSEQLVLMVSIIKLMIGVVIWAHFVACLWYGLGNSGSPDDQHWVKVYNYDEQSLAMRYCISMHWSLSQLQGGMGDITPTNPWERFYAIVIFLIAFVMASVVVSSITSLMTKLNLIGNHQTQQLAVLRQYMLQNGISRTLAIRVQRSAHRAMMESQRVMPETSVELMSVVSEALRVEIHFEMRAPKFVYHPFFFYYIDQCPQVMRRVCHSAMSPALASRLDTIFNVGEIPAQPRMYVVSSGVLEYSAFTGEVAEVRERQWISEASLWTRWMHRGSLSATTDCWLLALDARRFQDIVNQFKHDGFDPKRYAGQFVSKLNSFQLEATDLPFLDDECREAAHDAFAEEAVRAKHKTPGLLSRLKRSTEVWLTRGQRRPPSLSRTSRQTLHVKVPQTVNAGFAGDGVLPT